jgi:predicted dehydrogenase
MERQEVRWGILGTAEIAKKFVQAVKAAGMEAPTTIVAVASRSLDRAQGATLPH